MISSLYVDDPASCIDLEALEVGWNAEVEAYPRFREFTLGISVLPGGGDDLRFAVQIRCASDSEWCDRRWDARFMALPAQPIRRADCPAVADAVVAKAKEHLRDLVVALCDAQPLACGAEEAPLVGPWTVGVGASSGPTLRALALEGEVSRDLALGRVRPTLGLRTAVGAPVGIDVVVPGCRLPDAPACKRPRRDAAWASLAATIGASAEVGPAWGEVDVAGGLLVAGGAGFPEGHIGAAPIGALRVSGGLVGLVGPFASVEAGLYPTLVAEYAEPVALPAVRLNLGLRAVVP